MLQILFVLSGFIFAQGTSETENLKAYGWTIKNESEVSIVAASGNTESQTSSLKQKNHITKEKNTYRFKGNYLRTKTDDIETGKSWLLGLRYERGLSKNFRAFFGAESLRDTYAGFSRRISVDLGGKYFFIQGNKQELLSELNIRSTKEKSVSGQEETKEYARVFLEWSSKWAKGLKTDIWAEYLHNLDDDEAYFVNSEVSLSYVLNSIVSLKFAYETKYQNKPLVANVDKLDELYTTSLVASF